jgi:hypothetical protein
MPQKMLLCFSSISAKILVHIQAEAFVLATKFGTFFPYAADIKSIKNSAQKLLCFGTKSVGEIDPWCLIVAPIIDIEDANIDCLSLFMCPLQAQLKIGFFSSFSDVAVYSTNEANKAGLKQSIIFRCLWLL